MQTTTHQTVSQVAAQTSPRVSPNCVWRWARRGCKARNGQRIRLEHARCGGRLGIPEGALQRFFASLAAADCEYFDRGDSQKPLPVPPKLATTRESPIPKWRRKQLECTDRELHARGVM